jgi:lipoyl(octanoyl) transferase
MLRARWLGAVPYREAEALQRAVHMHARDDYLLLLEHPHVYTLGSSAKLEHVLCDPAEVGAELVTADRGGDVTYHGPGQLVGYPIVNLSPDRRDIRRYVRDLQEVLIRTLAEYGIAARPGEEQAFIGVWAGEAKIASIGVHLSRWITTHGFALNVSTDLSYFTGIIPCGLHQVSMTSIERLLGKAPPLPEIAAVCARHFGQVFQRDLVAALPADREPAAVGAP